MIPSGRRARLSLLLAASCAAVSVRCQEPVPTGDREGLVARAAVVERHGITWRFDREVSVGAFANGDPWVIGPVRIVAIEPVCTEVDGRVLHGSMLDPDPGSMRQGYDSGMFGDKNRERYAAVKNVARGVGAEHPLAIEPGHSLVSVESRPQAGVVPTLERAAVLTVLALPPAPDAFRPPYCQGDKAIRFRAADLDFGVLGREKPTLDAPPIEDITAQFERLWLDHFKEWPVRYVHPLSNMPDYGRELAATVGSGGLALQWDVPDAKKRLLLIRMVQIGLDLQAILDGGGRFEGLGGHGHGRKFPILLAGAVLHDERMFAVGKRLVSERTGPKQAVQFFGEDGQTFYVRETSPGVFNWGAGGYTKDHDGLPEWGFSHGSDVQNDRSGWDDNPYRRCCTANGWVGEVLATRMMGLVDAWNHPALFDYMDRYMQVDHKEGWHRAWLSWQASMWDAYRPKY